MKSSDKCGSPGKGRRGNNTVETVAINAVMAGAKPELFPAILALAASQTDAHSSSTSSMAAMAVFNGRIVEQLQLNPSTGALGLYNDSGALIGRAWSLLSMNATGGSVPGHTYEGVQGNPMADVPAVFAENIVGLPPGWKPLSVQKGFQEEDNVVSTFDGCQSPNTMMVLQDEDWDWNAETLYRRPWFSPTRRQAAADRPVGDTPAASLRLRHKGKTDQVGEGKRDDSPVSLIGSTKKSQL